MHAMSHLPGRIINSFKLLEAESWGWRGWDLRNVAGHLASDVWYSLRWHLSASVILLLSLSSVCLLWCEHLFTQCYRYTHCTHQMHHLTTCPTVEDKLDVSDLLRGMSLYCSLMDFQRVILLCKSEPPLSPACLKYSMVCVMSCARRFSIFFAEILVLQLLICFSESCLV